MPHPQHMHLSDVQTFTDFSLRTTHLKAPFVVCLKKTLFCIKKLVISGPILHYEVLRLHPPNMLKAYKHYCKTPPPFPRKLH